VLIEVESVHIESTFIVVESIEVFEFSPVPLPQETNKIEVKIKKKFLFMI
jgi:hypothetical protein